MFYVYFIKSEKNSKIYVGMTGKDPQLRLKEHNSGSNVWSSSNGPFRLVYFEKYHCKKDAIAREGFYKSGFGKLLKDSIIKTLEDHKFWGRSSVG
jgi:putative endonuclease